MENSGAILPWCSHGRFPSTTQETRRPVMPKLGAFHCQQLPEKAGTEVVATDDHEVVFQASSEQDGIAPVAAEDTLSN